jgi:hypothetical protein
VSLGLQVVRVAVWASAVTLAASAVKDCCYLAADVAVSDLETQMKRSGLGDGGEEEENVEDEAEEEEEGDDYLEAEAEEGAALFRRT